MGEISNNANRLFKELKINKIFTKIGNGLQGWDGKNSFDAIIVTGSLPNIPNNLLKDLKDGSMFITIGKKPVMRATTLKKENDGIIEEILFDTNIPRLMESE